MDTTPIMRIPFAAAPHNNADTTGSVFFGARGSKIGVVPAQGATPIAANDNDLGGARGAASDQMLRAALRHFAQHGLSAAREARTRAEAAFFAGDRQAYDWWLGITRTLDRRLADAVNHAAPSHQ